MMRWWAIFVVVLSLSRLSLLVGRSRRHPVDLVPCVSPTNRPNTIIFILPLYLAWSLWKRLTRLDYNLRYNIKNNTNLALVNMSLQFGLRRGITTASTLRSSATAHAVRSIRWQSSGADAGDVIGIDLGTTNSCVAIMVSWIFRIQVACRLRCVCIRMTTYLVLTNTWFFAVRLPLIPPLDTTCLCVANAHIHRKDAILVWLKTRKVLARHLRL